METLLKYLRTSSPDHFYCSRCPLHVLNAHWGTGSDKWTIFSRLDRTWTSLLIVLESTNRNLYEEFFNEHATMFFAISHIFKLVSWRNNVIYIFEVSQFTINAFCLSKFVCLKKKTFLWRDITTRVFFFKYCICSIRIIV